MILDEQAMQETQTVLTEELAAKGVTAIPWMALLQMLMSLLAGCVPAPTPHAATTYKSLAANPGLWGRFQASRIMLGIMGRSASYHDVSRAVQAGFDAIGKASDDTVLKLATAAREEG